MPYRRYQRFVYGLYGQWNRLGRDTCDRFWLRRKYQCGSSWRMIKTWLLHSRQVFAREKHQEQANRDCNHINPATETSCRLVCHPWNLFRTLGRVERDFEKYKCGRGHRHARPLEFYSSAISIAVVDTARHQFAISASSSLLVVMSGQNVTVRSYAEGV